MASKTGVVLPPTGRHKILYYTLGMTPPVAHADWVRRDIWSTGWLVRRAVQFVAGFLLGMLIVVLVLDASGAVALGLLVGGVLGAMLQLTVMANYTRRRSLAYYEKRWAKQQAS